MSGGSDNIADQIVATFLTNFKYLNQDNKRVSFADGGRCPRFFRMVENVFLDRSLTPDIENIAEFLQVIFNEENRQKLWETAENDDDEKIARILAFIEAALIEVKGLRKRKHKSIGLFEKKIDAALTAMQKHLDKDSRFAPTRKKVDGLRTIALSDEYQPQYPCSIALILGRYQIQPEDLGFQFRK